jgi:hypothetical protein
MPTSLDVTQSPATRSGWLAGIAGSLRENSPILFAIALYWAASDIASGLLGDRRTLDNAFAGYAGFGAILVACLAAAFVIWILHLTLVRNISIQTRDAWRRVFTEFLSRDRILLSLPVLALWPFLAQAFSAFKELIPAIQPFYLDQSLHALDRIIHLGNDPWTLLQPLFGHPAVTYVIDRLYALWFFVMYFAVLLQMTSTNERRLRVQFLLGSVLAWTLLGSLAAVLLSSAGPCYFGDVTGSPDPYAPLMSYLRDTVQDAHLSIFGHELSSQLIAVGVQDMLWDGYQGGDGGFGHGISAAPSMHVASTWLVARMLQARGPRVLAVCGWSFFAVILLGSIHLGWHYAVDGYISIAGAWAIWHAVGWWLDRPAVQRFLWPRLPMAAKVTQI